MQTSRFGSGTHFRLDCRIRSITTNIQRQVKGFVRECPAKIPFESNGLTDAPTPTESLKDVRTCSKWSPLQSTLQSTL